MNKCAPLVIALCAILVRPPSLAAQEVSADTLHVKQIAGEDVRDLIGHVVLTQEKTRVTCDRALQYIARGVFFLTGNVVVTDDSMTLRAPRGTYNRPERRAEGFDGVTLDDGTTRLTASYGEYFAEDRRAFFHTHVVVVDTSSIVTADSLLYWRSDRRSRALGHVVVRSPADRLTISGGRLDHDAVHLYSRMTVSPLLVQVDSAGEGRYDTLRVRGLVLESFRDSTRRLIARDSVELLRSDLAATARYACFFTAGDSILLRQTPVIWYRETQVTGTRSTSTCSGGSSSASSSWGTRSRPRRAIRSTRSGSTRSRGTTCRCSSAPGDSTGRTWKGGR